jgi:acetyl-CoA C-acetyltransferase
MKKFEPVYIVDGARSPFLKSRNVPGPFSASDLATISGRALLARQPFAPEQLDEVIVGCAGPSVDEVNIGRVIALRLGCGNKVPGWTVMRNCASGMQALDSAIANIQNGRSQLVLAGGVDALSRTPLLYSDKMVMWFSLMAQARSLGAKLGMFAKLRPAMLLTPVIGIVKGLTDPVVNLMMGQTAENLAWKFGISRQQMDAFSVDSHKKVSAAQKAGRFDEIVPLIDGNGKVYAEDDGVRHDSSLEGLAKLKPFFDRTYGKITPGNSSQITDGAAWLLLASGEAVEKYKLTPIGRITDTQWAGLDPAQMGLGPVHAATPILQRHDLGLNDLDAWEINEAFAAQVMGCVKAWEDPAYCREELGLDAPLGTLDPAKLNIDGGAIALGHPVGASGARIVLHLLHILRREKQAARHRDHLHRRRAGRRRAGRSRLRRGSASMPVRLDYGAKPELPRLHGADVAAQGPLRCGAGSARHARDLARPALLAARACRFLRTFRPAGRRRPLHPPCAHGELPHADGNAQPPGFPAADLARAAGAQPPDAARGRRPRCRARPDGTYGGVAHPRKGPRNGPVRDRGTPRPHRLRGGEYLLLARPLRHGAGRAARQPGPRRRAACRMADAGTRTLALRPAFRRFQPIAHPRRLCAPPGLRPRLCPSAARHRPVPGPPRRGAACGDDAGHLDQGPGVLRRGARPARRGATGQRCIRPARGWRRTPGHRWPLPGYGQGIDMSSYRHWKLERDTSDPNAGVVWAILDTADSSTNTLGAEVMVELRLILDELEKDRPKGLIFKSAKEAGFIAGANIEEFTSADTPEKARLIIKRGWDIYNQLAAVKYPTLALVRGHCMGGGTELALACRYRIAVDEPGTKFALPEVMLGIVPGWGGMLRLPQIVGPAAAMDMMLTGKNIDAKRAKKMGLADECVPPRVMENAARMRVLSGKPPRHRNCL